MSMEGRGSPEVATPRTHAHPLVAAIRSSTRLELIGLLVMLGFYALLLGTFAISWPTHDAALQMRVTSFGTFVMYVVCVGHCLSSRGTRATIGFFGLSWIIPFCAEYVGANYGLIFGSYDYTGTMGPSIGGVSLLIPFSWSILQYGALTLICWLLGLGGERRGTTWIGRIGWSAVVALAVGVAVTSLDLMTDPAYVSDVWEQVLGVAPWWWWSGGPYLPDLQVWQGAGGIPVVNFVGWAAVTFVVIFLFLLFFGGHGRRLDRLVDVTGLLMYAFTLVAVGLELAEMSWYDPGLVQPMVIGVFAVGPLVTLGVVKFAQMYWTPPSPGTTPGPSGAR
jgi:uncharacterized membrane protein